ncbi:hypothetical protein A2U01_0060432, partial [Trifolium medium]|nr:hypothetical protein [Trifolium medium]
RKKQSSSSIYVACPNHSNDVEGSQHVYAATDVVKQSNPSNAGNKKKQSCSVSSADDILCCSSINSSDIRNCNKKFMQRYDQEAASKVWRGALELGVEVTWLR